MNKILLVFILSACVLVSCKEPKEADKPSSPPPEAIVDEHEDPAASTGETNRAYYFPTPGEIFRAISKIDNIQWLQNATLLSQPDYSNDYENSFWMGVCVADAFVALEAENRDVFAEMNQGVFALSEKLGISGELDDAREKLARSQDGGDVAQLTADLDRLYMDFVRLLGNYRNGETIYTFSNIGGWAEGVEIIGSHVAANFNEESAKLLFDDRLVNELLERVHLFNSKEKIQKIEDLKVNLQKAKEIIEANEDSVNVQAVKSLTQVAKNILQTFK